MEATSDQPHHLDRPVRVATVNVNGLTTRVKHGTADVQRRTLLAHYCKAHAISVVGIQEHHMVQSAETPDDWAQLHRQQWFYLQKGYSFQANMSEP